MAINTVYLTTPSGSTTVLSDLSIAGTLDAGVVESAGAVTAGAAVTGDTLTVGAGTSLVKLSSLTVPVVAITATATKSTTTTYAFSGATTAADATNPQVFICTPTSAMSPGVVVDAYASTTDVVTIRYSNVSTANAAVAAHTLRVTLLQF
jgi:hypothetical protein